MVVASYSNVGSIDNLDPLGTPIDVRISCVSEQKQKRDIHNNPKKGGTSLVVGSEGVPFWDSTSRGVFAGRLVGLAVVVH